MLNLFSSGSTRRLPAPWLLIAIGLLTGSIGASLIYFGGRWTRGVTRSASDYLMNSDTGPRLGMRSDPGDVVIVQYGRASAERLGTAANIETDKQVYENLLAAGAKAVADPRLITSLLPEQFEAECKPALEMMAAIEGSRGKLVRDVLLSSTIDYESVRKFDDYIRHESIGFRNPIDVTNQSRLSPFADHDLFALRESMVIWLARRQQGLPIATEDEIAKALSDSGIVDVWLYYHPVMENLLPESEMEFKLLPYQVGSLSIPWVPFEGEVVQASPAGFWIDHTQRADSFPILDYGAVAKGDFDEALVKDRLVLIGVDTDFVRPERQFELPSQRSQVDITALVALAVQTLINDRIMQPFPLWVYWSTVLVLALLVSLLVGRGSVKFAVLSGLAVLLGYMGVAMIAYRGNWFTDMAVAPSVIAVTGVLTGVVRYGYEVRWRNRMTDLFGRYVPRAVVTDLISKRALQSIAVGGKRRDVTVMFADIRGFTRFTESNQPETVLDRLNEFLQVMVDCTFEQDGTVDKFIGDAILVLFNAPTDQSDHAERAVKTAWAIQKKLGATIEDYGNSELQIGIGIHTGDAIVGTVGTPERMEYTAIGSTVNTASRLCDRADGGKVVVSQQVVDAVGDRFEWSQNEPMTVKGIDRPLDTATLVGISELPPNAS
ncbi:adenylate/guanylate cyclase domain-containing protein [Planctomycetes bacterium K23_9]|uniref:Adenylate cyclase 1 n=1 Tax=Stieleria marina TaxID=1930275 RepID=A0A517P374_9BACT|nr:Adenylate cyclase 1 [Planctomycetes bacterium K23_9]